MPVYIFFLQSSESNCRCGDIQHKHPENQSMLYNQNSLFSFWEETPKFDIILCLDIHSLTCSKDVLHRFFFFILEPIKDYSFCFVRLLEPSKIPSSFYFSQQRSFCKAQTGCPEKCLTQDIKS